MMYRASSSTMSFFFSLPSRAFQTFSPNTGLMLPSRSFQIHFLSSALSCLTVDVVATASMPFLEKGLARKGASAVVGSTSYAAFTVASSFFWSSAAAFLAAFLASVLAILTVLAIFARRWAVAYGAPGVSARCHDNLKFALLKRTADQTSRSGISLGIPHIRAPRHHARRHVRQAALARLPRTSS